MEKIPDEVRKQIEEGVKEIAKKSTAPDKETPDWMETDIRRGAEFGYFLASKASHPEQGEQGDRACPCLYLDEPCHERCTCRNGASSFGCLYCATYGGIEQRKETAKRIAEKLKPQGEQGELYKWVKATSDNLPKFNDVIPRQVFAIRYKNVSGSYNYGWLTANQISDYRKSSLYNDLEWLCKLSSPPPEGQNERGNHPEIPDSSKQDELWEEIENELDGQVYRNQINCLKSKYLLIKK